MNLSPAIVFFAATITLTLVVTAIAARRGARREDLYAAGGRISGFHNGWAIAGDFMSATTFLGITALYFAGGVDTAIFYLSP
ncbi:MAG: sodium:solute symporter family transporter, partial [Steroidobacteraceae bacterium]